jgi:hypothetical protein
MLEVQTLRCNLVLLSATNKGAPAISSNQSTLSQPILNLKRAVEKPNYGSLARLRESFLRRNDAGIRHRKLGWDTHLCNLPKFIADGG